MLLMGGGYSLFSCFWDCSLLFMEEGSILPACCTVGTPGQQLVWEFAPVPRVE